MGLSRDGPSRILSSSAERPAGTGCPQGGKGAPQDRTNLCGLPEQFERKPFKNKDILSGRESLIYTFIW